MGEERVNQGRRGWEDKEFIKCSCVRIYYISSGLFIPFHTPMILFSFRYLFLRKGYLLSPLLFILMYPPPPHLIICRIPSPIFSYVRIPSRPFYLYFTHISLYTQGYLPPPLLLLYYHVPPPFPKKMFKRVKIS